MLNLILVYTSFRGLPVFVNTGTAIWRILRNYFALIGFICCHFREFAAKIARSNVVISKLQDDSLCDDAPL